MVTQIQMDSFQTETEQATTPFVKSLQRTVFVSEMSFVSLNKVGRLFITPFGGALVL